MNRRSDLQLIQATRMGDPTAFGELFARHYLAGTRYASRFVGRADAADVVQETMASILEATHRGAGPEENFVAYFRRSLRNTAILMSNRARRELAFEDVEILGAVREGANGSPHEMVDPRMRAAASAALSSLSERWQQILIYTVIQGLAIAEAAPLIGLSSGATAQLAFRARAGLRQAWAAEMAAMCGAVAPFVSRRSHVPAADYMARAS